MRLALIFLFACWPGHAAISFKKQIAPLLLEKCVTCHGSEKVQGKFRADSYLALTRTGDSEKASIVPGAPEQSHLFQLLTTRDEDDRMPQKSDRLSDEQIALFKNWIAEGARFDGDSPEQNLAALIPYQPGPQAPERYPFPQPVLALAWTADGQGLASSGYHEVLLWNTNGVLTGRIARLPQRIHGLAFLQDGQVAMAGGTPGKSGEVLLCKPGSDETPRLLARLADVAVSLAINQEKTLLAAGGSDNSIRLFELPSGKEVRIIQQHADWVTSVAFSADGSKLASASRDRTARFFDVRDGNLLETYAEHDQPLFAVAFASDGKRVFSAGRERKIHAWQIQDAKKAGEFAALEGDVLALCVAGKRVFASGGDKTIREFNADDRKLTRTLAGHRDWVYALAGHESTGRLASGSYDGEIRIWDIERGVELAAFKSTP